jgi:hypothetical protein
MRRGFFVFLLTFTLLTFATVAEVPSQGQDRGNPNIRVWVDTAYGYYHCPGTKWYGATSQGVYMIQKQAQDRGYRPALAVCK